MKRFGFTLIELLVVIAIMGLLGTTAVGGYRAMQRGMEERGVMQNVNQFVHAAYQRAQIDRVPVAVYFWNETLREETDDDTMLVVGKAVAVRRAGRISSMRGNDLYDEFGDLRFRDFTFDSSTSEDFQDENSGEDDGVYLYPINGSKDGNSLSRSIVKQKIIREKANIRLMSQDNSQSVEIERYGFNIIASGGVNWSVGDAYGLEFAEIQLPDNFIFGSTYQSSAGTAIADVTKLMFKPGRNTGSGSQGGTMGTSTVQVSALRPNSSGALSAESLGSSKDPTQEGDN